MKAWKGRSFQEVCVEVLSRFIDEDEIPRKDLCDLVRRTYNKSAFRNEKEIVPVVHLKSSTSSHSRDEDADLKIMELFHGPTFAFKDVALQFLGNLFEYFLERSNEKNKTMTVLGATSGDTGSAAIAGLRGKRGIQTFILFPEGKVSEIQEIQMTTRAAASSNVHCVAVKGTFDDAQAIVKKLFVDTTFNETFKLGAVNSINFARVLAQIVYYAHVSLQFDGDVNFVVPTGNFGNVLAGFYAAEMGFPVGKLVVATNENDVVHRFLSRGEYHRKACASTITPSMDIALSSNLERFLYWIADGDTDVVSGWMGRIALTGKLTLSTSGPEMTKARSAMMSESATEHEILSAMHRVHTNHDYFLCPHSAVGVVAYEKLRKAGELRDGATVCLATAHHAKFPDAVRRACRGSQVPTEPLLEALKTKPKSKHIVEATTAAVKTIMYDLRDGVLDGMDTSSLKKSVKKNVNRTGTPHPRKGILKRRKMHVERNQSTYAVALDFVSSLFTPSRRRPRYADEEDGVSLSIVAGALVVGAAVGVGAYMVLSHKSRRN